MNLLAETIESLNRFDKHPADVVAIINNGIRCSWDQFAAAADFDYDNGFGSEAVNEGLLVVGSDWWIERHEYDGSEWWEFKRLPDVSRCAEGSVRLTGQYDWDKDSVYTKTKAQP